MINTMQIYSLHYPEPFHRQRCALGTRGDPKNFTITQLNPNSESNEKGLKVDPLQNSESNGRGLKVDPLQNIN